MDGSWITTINWSTTSDVLQGIGAVLGPVSVGVAALVGSQTFKTWRLQKLSERRIEQAERILTAVYRARRDLSYVRNPAVWNHELATAEASLKETGEWNKIVGEEAQRRFTTTRVYYSRLSKTRDDQRTLEECQPMARALFGEALEAAIEKLNHQFWTVQVYVDAKHDYEANADAEFRRKIDSAIFEGFPSPEENEVDQAIVAQVKVIEEICVPVLRLEGRSH